jgi:hypothetical protein
MQIPEWIQLIGIEKHLDMQNDHIKNTYLVARFLRKKFVTHVDPTIEEEGEALTPTICMAACMVI